MTKLARFLNSRRDRIWKKRSFSIAIEDDKGKVLHTISAPANALALPFTHFLSDIGQAFFNRYECGSGIRCLTTGNIEFEDGFVQLPKAGAAVDVINDPLAEYYHICKTVFDFNGIVESTKKDHFMALLNQLIDKSRESEFQVFAEFQKLLIHYILNSSASNLMFVLNALKYLRTKKSSWSDKLPGNWRGAYGHFSQSRLTQGKYEILKAIKANPWLCKVYYYNAAADKDEYNDAAAVDSVPYTNDSVGLLYFMVNVIKHVNDHRLRHGLTPWTDEEIEAILEVYFPGELQHLFEFFWKNDLDMDFGDSLRSGS